jgi:hypothetical protein
VRRFTVITVIALVVSAAFASAALAASTSHQGVAHHRRGGGLGQLTTTRGANPVPRHVAPAAQGSASRSAVFAAGAVSLLLVGATTLVVVGQRRRVRLARAYGAA